MLNNELILQLLRSWEIFQPAILPDIYLPIIGLSNHYHDRQCFFTGVFPSCNLRQRFFYVAMQQKNRLVPFQIYPATTCPKRTVIYVSDLRDFLFGPYLQGKIL